MRLTLFLMMLVIVSFTATLADAQIYQYRDSDGHIRYTDDLGKIPVNQREDAGRLREMPWSESEPAKQEVEAQRDADRDPAREAKELRDEEEQLQATYERLEEQKSKIGDPPGPGASREELAAYQTAVEELNTRILSYQEAVEDYERRVRLFNERYRR